MSAPDYVLVSFNDWQAFYCNGEKVLEDHRLDTKTVLAEMDSPCRCVRASDKLDAVVSESGYVPDDLSELEDMGTLE